MEPDQGKWNGLWYTPGCGLRSDGQWIRTMDLDIGEETGSEKKKK